MSRRRPQLRQAGVLLDELSLSSPFWAPRLRIPTTSAGDSERRRRLLREPHLRQGCAPARLNVVLQSPIEVDRDCRCLQNYRALQGTSNARAAKNCRKNNEMDDLGP